MTELEFDPAPDVQQYLTPAHYTRSPPRTRPTLRLSLGHKKHVSHFLHSARNIAFATTQESCESCHFKIVKPCVRYYILPHHALIFPVFSPTTMAVTPVDFSTANNVYVEKKCDHAWLAKRGGHGMWSVLYSMRHLGCADWVARAPKPDSLCNSFLSFLLLSLCFNEVGFLSTFLCNLSSLLCC